MKTENENVDDQFNEPELGASSPAPSEFNFKAWAKKFYSILLMIIVLALTVGLGYQSVRLIQVTKAKEKERVLIQENVREVLLAKSKESLMLTMKPLVWAIRAEMIRENMDQTNQYVNELVKVRNFNLVMVVGTDGNILVASDKKLEGARFTESFNGKYIASQEAGIELVDSSMFHISSPIMGFDSRLGTLFIEYFPQQELHYKVPTLEKEEIEEKEIAEPAEPKKEAKQKAREREVKQPEAVAEEATSTDSTQAD